MKSYYSLLRFVSNSLSAENLVLGLVMVGAGGSFFRLSERKVKLAKKLNPAGARLLNFSLRKLTQQFPEEMGANRLAKESASAPGLLMMLERLSAYQNGLLQFSKPVCVERELSAAMFAQYVDLLIGEAEAAPAVASTASKPSPLSAMVKQQLYEPLRQQVDVDYTLRSEQLPSLFFDFHFDSLGVNGSVYAAKAVDFNSTRRVADIKQDISAYESVIERLNTFASDRGITGEPHCYLIADPYRGSAPSYADLYTLLKEQNMPFFNLVTSADLPDIVAKVVDSQARKFSTELLGS